jgi:LPS-assembly lipoprotein
MRGAADIAYSTIHIQGNTLIVNKKLIKLLKINGVKVVESAESAELLLDMVGEESEKRILSVGGQGKVNEYELYYRVHYRTKGAEDALWSQVQTVEARRDYTFDDSQLLGKQAEENRLNQDMQNDVTYSIMRRLAVLGK